MLGICIGADRTLSYMWLRWQQYMFSTDLIDECILYFLLLRNTCSSIAFHCLRWRTTSTFTCNVVENTENFVKIFNKLKNSRPTYWSQCKVFSLWTSSYVYHMLFLLTVCINTHVYIHIYMCASTWRLNLKFYVFTSIFMSVFFCVWFFLFCTFYFHMFLLLLLMLLYVYVVFRAMSFSYIKCYLSIDHEMCMCVYVCLQCIYHNSL